MMGHCRPVNHRTSQSFKGLGRFQPRELHKLRRLQGTRRAVSLLCRPGRRPLISTGIGDDPSRASFFSRCPRPEAANTLTERRQTAGFAPGEVIVRLLNRAGGATVEGLVETGQRLIKNGRPMTTLGGTKPAF